MKRIFLGIIILLVLLWAGATFVISGLTQKGFRSYADKKLEGRAGEVAEIFQMDLTAYKKGFLFSTATSSIAEPGGGEEGDDLPLIHKVYHGPLAVTPDGVKACFSYAVTTIDWSKVDKKISERLKKTFGDKEPVTLTVLSDYAQNHIIDVTVPSAEYSDDEGVFRFDGASIHLEAGKDAKTMKGDGEITALTLKIDTEETKLFISTEPTKFDFDVAEGRHAKANFAIGKIKSTGTSKEEGSEEFGMEFSGIQSKTDFTSSSQTPNVMIGTAFAEIPSLSVTVGEGKNFKLTNIRFDQIAEEKDGKVNGEICYKIKGFESDMAEMAMVQEMVKGGVELTLGIGGFSTEVIEALAKIGQENNKATLKALSQNEVPTTDAAINTKMVESLINGIEKGTNLFVTLTIGENKNQSKVAIGLSYDGAKKLLDVKTNGELISTLIGKIEASLPKALVDSNPLYMMMLGPQIEQGMIKTTADAYTFGANIKDSKVQMNGADVPFIDMMGPMLKQEIPWDDVIKGMADGMSGPSK